MIPQNSQMSPEEAKASLGIATHLQGMLLPQAPVASNPAPEPPTNQQTSQDLQTEMQGLESRIMDEIGTLKEEIKKAQPQDSNKQIDDLKKQIEDVLNSND